MFQIIGPHTSVNEVTLGLIMTHKRFPLDLIAAVLDTFGWLAVSVALWRLQKSVEVRSPKPRVWLRWVACVGGVFYAIPPTVLAIKSTIAANAFVSSGSQTYVEAHALVTGGALLPTAIVAYYLGQFMFAGGFIMVALGAMRVGLVPRNLGFVGIAGGAFILDSAVRHPDHHVLLGGWARDRSAWPMAVWHAARMERRRRGPVGAQAPRRALGPGASPPKAAVALVGSRPQTVGRPGA